MWERLAGELALSESGKLMRATQLRPARRRLGRYGPRGWARACEKLIPALRIGRDHRELLLLAAVDHDTGPRVEHGLAP